MITRQVPYKVTGLNGFALALKVAQEGLRPEVPSYCPKEIHDLMVRCWDEDEKVRPDFRTIMKELQDISGKVRRIQKEKRMALQNSALRAKENWELEMELEGIGEDGDDDDDDDDDDGEEDDDSEFDSRDATQIDMSQVEAIEKHEEEKEEGGKRTLVEAETASAESAAAKDSSSGGGGGGSGDDGEEHHEKMIRSASAEELELMIAKEKEKRASLRGSRASTDADRTVVNAEDVKVTVNDEES